MRISDWSSDVCSSDLTTNTVTARESSRKTGSIRDFLAVARRDPTRLPAPCLATPSLCQAIGWRTNRSNELVSGLRHACRRPFSAPGTLLTCGFGTAGEQGRKSPGTRLHPLVVPTYGYHYI